MAAKYLKTHWGIDAARGVQYSGSTDSPDVKSDALIQVGLHVEVKFDNRVVNKSVSAIFYPTLCNGILIIPQDYIEVELFEPEIDNSARISNKSLLSALDQAERDSGGDQTPFVMAKGNRTKWFFVVRESEADSFLEKVRKCIDN